LGVLTFEPGAGGPNGSLHAPFLITFHFGPLLGSSPRDVPMKLGFVYGSKSVSLAGLVCSSQRKRLEV